MSRPEKSLQFLLLNLLFIYKVTLQRAKNANAQPTHPADGILIVIDLNFNRVAIQQQTNILAPY